MPSKVYVAFDYANASAYYNVMRSWASSDAESYLLMDSVGVKLDASSKTQDSIQMEFEARIADSAIVVFLVNEFTKYPFRYFAWEISIAVRLGKPLLVVNLNGAKVPDQMCCPDGLMQTLALHVPFNQKVVEYAIAHWVVDSARFQTKRTSYYYSESVFVKLGI